MKRRLALALHQRQSPRAAQFYGTLSSAPADSVQQSAIDGCNRGCSRVCKSRTNTGRRMLSDHGGRQLFLQEGIANAIRLRRRRSIHRACRGNQMSMCLSEAREQQNGGRTKNGGCGSKSRLQLAKSSARSLIIHSRRPMRKPRANSPTLRVFAWSRLLPRITSLRCRQTTSFKTHRSLDRKVRCLLANSCPLLQCNLLHP